MLTHSPLPWHMGHLSDPDHPCNCPWIVNETYMGAICEIYFDNGKLVSQGGNDAPPREEAIENMKFIVKAVNHHDKLVEALKKLVRHDSVEFIAPEEMEIDLEEAKQLLAEVQS